MAIGLDPKQIVSSEQVLMSLVVSQDALSGCLWRREYLAKKRFWKW